MSTLLSLSDLPRDADGAIVGRFVARHPGGGSVEGWEGPLDPHEPLRLDAAMAVRFEPLDADTAERCARAVFLATGDGAKAKTIREAFGLTRQKTKGKRR